MGQTLATAAQWTSAREQGRGKLEFSPANELILNRILQFAEGFGGSHPEESKLIFKQPLSWETDLTHDELQGLGSSRGEDLASDATTKDGHPLFSAKKRGKRMEVSVMSLEFAEKVLRVAAAKKLMELRLCLEANSDPVAKMLGDRFATVDQSDTSTFRFMEEIMREQEQKKGAEMDAAAGEDAGVKKTELKLLLLIKDFDNKLLQEALKKATSEVKVNPADVDRIVEILRKFSGPDDTKHVLRYIEWVEPYTFVFKNGCRAPLGRQVHGDISYVEIRPHDAESIYVTASTYGYFVNKGVDPEKGQLQFDKNSEYYRDLIVLIREKSPVFSQLMEQQDVFKVEERHSWRGDVDVTYDDESQTKSDSKGRKVREADGEGKKGEKEKRDDKDDRVRKLEPSLKWKNLEIEKQKQNEDKLVPKKKAPQKKTKKESQLKIKGRETESYDSFEESSSESEEEDETLERRPDLPSDLPSEYWQIQKLVKYLKGGNQTATIIALCSLRDFSLDTETCQLAIRDVGGLEVLINLLDTDELKCKIGSLKILKEISQNPHIRRAIADLGGLQTMVKILRDPNKELRCLAAETIGNVAKFRRARRTVRQHDGIRKLVALLDCVPLTSVTTAEQQKDVDVARCGALALWSCSHSRHNKQAMRKAGVIPLLARLLKSTNEEMLIPVVGTLQECATEPSYRLAIRTEGMIEDLVKNLSSKNEQLQMHCARAIFKCAEEKETRDLVRKYGGLDPLVKLLANANNKDLLAAATGAIWKCAICAENVKRFQELKTIDVLVSLLSNQPEEVLVNVVGALAELAKEPENRGNIRKAGGLQPLISLLTGTNQALLVNVTKAVGQCAEEPENMAVIDKLDGVRLLWSLLKNQNPDVQASAAWALCPCIENAKDAGEMVRSFVGGLELIVSLLKSEHIEVLASVCAAIAKIARDEENLAVITDHGVVPMLAKLTNTKEDRLRKNLAEAIARCCNWGDNRERFGKEDAVAPLVSYLKSQDTDVHCSTAGALFQLSKHASNCVTMHKAGVVKPLVKMVGSENTVLQEAAAGCISNIRRLALANEKARNK